MDSIFHPGTLALRVDEILSIHCGELLTIVGKSALLSSNEAFCDAGFFVPVAVKTMFEFLLVSFKYMNIL